MKLVALTNTPVSQHQYQKLYVGRIGKASKQKKRHAYLKDFVWKEMNKLYKDIFSEALPINSPEILDDIVKKLSSLNLF